MKSKVSDAKARQQANRRGLPEGRDPEAVDPDPERSGDAAEASAAGDAGQLGGRAADGGGGGSHSDDDAWPWKFLGPEPAEIEEEKVEEDAAEAANGEHGGADETQLLLPQDSALFIREISDALEKMKAQPRAVLQHRMRELWKRQVAESAAATTEEEDGPPPPPLERVDSGAYVPLPGAYRIRTGQGPNLQRASSEDPSVFTEFGEPGRRSRQQQSRIEDPMYLAEANLVIEEDLEPAPPPLLVEATPIRRKRQIMIMAATGLAVIAVIVGLSVGMTANRPTLLTTPSPTPSPTSQLDEQFRPTLPSHTLDSLRNTSSPQYLAYEWATEVDEISKKEAQLSRQLERMKQRFALATLFFATGGERSWKIIDGWINATLHECQWFGCKCGTTDGPIFDDVYKDGSDNGALVAVRLSLNGLDQSLPREVGLLPSLTSLDLRKNALTGSLPTELGALTYLSNLTVSNNLFSGAIPSELGSLTELQGLHLNQNGLAGRIPSELGSLTRLMSLDFSNNLIRGGLPEEIGKLLELLDFTASRNYFSGTVPSTLGQLIRLRSLDLSDNNLKGSIPRSFKKLTQLVTLDMSQNQLTKLPKELGYLSALTSLDLSANALNSTIPTQLGALSRLKS
jgi:hypothetical protein